MFSSRIECDIKINRIAEILLGKGQFLDLTQSNPTAANLQYPERQILDAISSSESLVYEPSSKGKRSAREAVAAYYGHRVDPEQILLTASTSEAYGWIFKLLADPGDEVLVPRPSYPLFEFLASLENVRAVQYPLFYDGRWSLDIHAVENAITDRTRAIALVNPNNPAGVYLKRTEVDQLVSLCAARGLAIISDEVFADYAFADDLERITTLSGVNQVPTYVISGLSKVAGLPQFKLGWIVLNGPPQQYNDAMTRLELIADTYLSVATPIQLALPSLLEAAHGIRRQIRDRTQANLSYIQHHLAPDSPARLLHAEGGWYATLEVPRIRTEEEWVLELLEKYDVLAQPGYFYDFESEAFLVISLLTETGEFQRGMQRIFQFVRE
ncbi:MAG TPA: pyridoxal phosphate-dependent aminotransferase [Bryobacteraceae bacterium]|nr:pyridoxal phosphate-dependent aminotransferase [Bryobacteraceae bacterium]